MIDSSFLDDREIHGDSHSAADEREEVLERYSGSGENRNPSRILKIEEIVEWDMQFGVVIGPAGFDHRLRCPYCGKRLLLLSSEGARDRTGMRIVYRCENCAAHHVSTFQPPGQKLELAEAEYGERVIVETPTPIPNTPAEPTTERSQRQNSRSQNQQQRSESASSRNQRGQQRRNNSAANASSRSQGAQSSERSERTDRGPETRNRSRNNQGGRNNGRGTLPDTTTREASEQEPRGRKSPSSLTMSAHVRDDDASKPAISTDVQIMSEQLQEQEDRSQAQHRPYRRRRRPFRPSGSHNNS